MATRTTIDDLGLGTLLTKWAWSGHADDRCENSDGKSRFVRLDGIVAGDVAEYYRSSLHTGWRRQADDEA
jgi:hypothetical protein